MVEVARKSFFSIRTCFDMELFGLNNLLSRRNVIGGVAGYTADANSLVNYARSAAQQHLTAYNEDIPVEQLAQRLCDMKQGYTQYGG